MGITQEIETRVYKDAEARGYKTKGIEYLDGLRACEKQRELSATKLNEVNAFIKAQDDLLTPVIREILTSQTKSNEKYVNHLDKSIDRYTQWIHEYLEGANV